MAANAGALAKSTTQPQTGSLARRLAAGSLLLACCLGIFLLGANYAGLFPTNGNLLYNGILCVVFLAAVLYYIARPCCAGYWPAAYALFAAAAVNVVSCLLAEYSPRVLGLLGVQAATNAGLALDKVFSTVLAVAPILALTRLSGASLGSLGLQKGNQHFWWGIGIGLLVLVNFFTSVLIFFGGEYRLAQLGGVILWGLVFSFSNSLLEELWLRGLFIRNVTTLIGPVGAVLVTSLTFAALHTLNIAFLPAAVVPVMVANTLTLGLVCGTLMVKTGSIWGAFLVHAAADLFLFIAMLAFH